MVDVSPLRSRLPEDLVELIRKHVACARIQRAYRQRCAIRLHFAHTHDVRWAPLKEKLEGMALLPVLYPFPMIRKEWRQEMGSWTDLDEDTLRALGVEVAATDMWGRPSIYMNDLRSSKHGARSK